MKRKIVSCLVAVSMIASIITGCGNSSSTAASVAASTSESAAETSSSAEANTAADASSSEPVTLDMWTLLEQSDVEKDAWSNAIDEYQKAHPNVTINRSTYEGEAYKMKLKSAVAADELPDIFFSWAGGFSKPFIEAGKVYPLDDTYANFSNDLSSSMLDTCRYDGKLYGTVITPQASLLYYNKAMFDKYDLKPPTTYDELVNVCKTFIDNGITPFAISAKDTWGLATIMDQLMLKCAGHDKVVNTITRNGGAVDDDFLDAAKKFVELKNMGAFLKNASGVNTDEAYQYYINGTCPMWLMIDSLGNNITANLDDVQDYGVMLFPACSSNATVNDMMGGCGEMYCVSAASKHTDIASEAIFEICRSVAKYAAEKGSYTSAWNNQPLGEGSPDFMYDVEKMKSSATSYMLWWDTTMVADDAQEYLSLLQELYNGNITPEEFTSSLNDLFAE